MVEHGLLSIHCNALSYSQAQSLVRNLILRAFYSLPPGTLQVTIIDPDGLGRDYAHLMQLADVDPTMVNHRVWTQSVHIAEQLAKLSHHTEDVIQQLLRDKYKDIRQYNREAGSMAEPYRLVVWSRFPAGVDETTWKYLSSLISFWRRCGVSTILLIDDEFSAPPNVDLHRLDNVGLKIRLEQADAPNRFVTRVSDEALASFPIQLDSPPDAQMQAKSCKEFRRSVASQSG